MIEISILGLISLCAIAFCLGYLFGANVTNHYLDAQSRLNKHIGEMLARQERINEAALKSADTMLEILKGSQHES